MRPVAEQPAQGWSCEGATSAPVAATHSACGRRLQARQWQARGRDQRPRGVIYEHRGLTCMPFSCVPKCPFLCLGHSEGSRPRFAGSRRGAESWAPPSVAEKGAIPAQVAPPLVPPPPVPGPTPGPRSAGPSPSSRRRPVSPSCPPATQAPKPGGEAGGCVLAESARKRVGDPE